MFLTLIYRAKASKGSHGYSGWLQIFFNTLSNYDFTSRQADGIACQDL